MLAAALVLLTKLLTAVPLAQATPISRAEPAIPPVVWELVAISSAGERAVEIDQPGRYVVQFQTEGRLAIDADCNRVAATYTAYDGILDVTLSVSTLALCPSDSHGEPFLELLDGVTSFEIDPDGFLILSGEKGQLRLRPTLVRVVWEWQDFRGGDDSLLTPGRPEDYTLTFMPEGNLAIFADCIRTLGTYTVNGPTLDLSFDAATRAGCQPGSLAGQYLRDLSDVSSHVFRDGNLYLSLRTDAGIMAFAARYLEPPLTTPETG